MMTILSMDNLRSKNMTEKGKQRAAKALLKARTYGKMYFPKIFVVGDSVYFTYNAAKRASEFDGNPIEEMTIEFAHNVLYPGVKMPKDIVSNIDRNINQSGSLFENGQLYCRKKYMPEYHKPLNK